ncbi:hypothetical protein BDQ12DRAFT_676551 [Crucibulum laeve]|uniref:Uncharacterized protein n=1 Tax=Crucibulum laeve TaxID=68775 RepID=A0A5C3MD17_9AGAR|nr:hypothetical protein BDQ12DRAFT_676551 [Crucibulum laeve]
MSLFRKMNRPGLSAALDAQDAVAEPPKPLLPEIPAGELNVDFLSSIIGPTSAEEEKLKKRASSVLKLAEENEKLKEELKAMTDRLEAAERKRQQLRQEKEQHIMEPASS